MTIAFNRGTVAWAVDPLSRLLFRPRLVLAFLSYLRLMYVRWLI